MTDQSPAQEAARILEQVYAQAAGGDVYPTLLVAVAALVEENALLECRVAQEHASFVAELGRKEAAESSIAALYSWLRTGEPRLCLVCGASKPCMTDADLKPGDPGTPCTFEPTPRGLLIELTALRERVADAVYRGWGCTDSAQAFVKFVLDDTRSPRREGEP